MLLPKTAQHSERRQWLRRSIHRVAQIRLGNGTPPCECLITDISDGGVRLHIEKCEVPDEFVLLLSGTEVGRRERVYKVVWRLGYEIGARFIRNAHGPNGG